MAGLIESEIGCPYCGERISVLIDAEEVGQQYIEDCQVCCKPIVFRIAEDADGQILVAAHAEDEPW